MIYYSLRQYNIYNSEKTNPIQFYLQEVNLFEYYLLDLFILKIINNYLKAFFLLIYFQIMINFS